MAVDTSFSHVTRARHLDAMAVEPVDLLIVGGGITGAGIARDAARRGLRTALVDRGDFGVGTSSRSSRLIHGGIRYLEHREWALVFEASRERRTLLTIAPHLVRPLPFLLPVYTDDRLPLWKTIAGLWLYDLLALFRNVRTHRWQSKRSVRRREPGIRTRGLRGGALYYDARCDDARLTLATIRDAHAAGALVASYASLEGFDKASGRITGAHIRDTFTGRTCTVRAMKIVNATGPWADAVRRLDDPSLRPLVRLTRGAHVAVLRQRLGNQGAVTFTSPIDGRVMFVLPWEHLAYIGTTDTDFAESPDAVRVTGDDVVYLLRSANALYPAARLAADDVVSSWAGVRALVRSEAAAPASSVSREHVVEELPSGLLTIAGGKLTTYRAMAEELVDRVVRDLIRLDGRPAPGRCTTAEEPLPGGAARDLDLLRREALEAGVSGETASHLVHSYGSEVPALLKLLVRDRSLGAQIVPGLPPIRAELTYSATRELVMTLEDFLVRRVHLSQLDPGHALAAAPQVARQLGAELGWDDWRVRGEVEQYNAHIAESRSFAEELKRGALA